MSAAGVVLVLSFLMLDDSHLAGYFDFIALPFDIIFSIGHQTMKSVVCNRLTLLCLPDVHYYT